MENQIIYIDNHHQKCKDILNVPNDIGEGEWIVAVDCEGEFWFWGAYKTKEEAIKASEWLGETTLIGQK